MRNWRARLTPLQQRIYDRSASITSIQLTPTPQLLEATTALAGALVADDQLRVEALAQTIVNHICGRLKVRTVRVLVTVGPGDLAASHSLTFSLSDRAETRDVKTAFVPGAAK